MSLLSSHGANIHSTLFSDNGIIRLKDFCIQIELLVVLYIVIIYYLIVRYNGIDNKRTFSKTKSTRDKWFVTCINILMKYIIRISSYEGWYIWIRRPFRCVFNSSPLSATYMRQCKPFCWRSRSCNRNRIACAMYTHHIILLLYTAM